MKLKDYVIPQNGLDGGADPEDLAQYSLKNFDLKAFQLTQQPEPAPILAPAEHHPYTPEADILSPPPPAAPALWSPAPEQPTAPSFAPAANPAPIEPPTQFAMDPADVKFGVHFDLQTVAYSPLAPAESWKLPRWVITTVGLFFGSAAVLTLACCVVLLRDAKPAPPEQVAAPTAPVVTTPVAPVAAAAPAPAATNRAAVPQSSPAIAKLMRDDAPPARRVVVSRHPSVVRRQVYGARRVASKSASPAVEAQETETASRRPPQDALDKLLGESTL